MNNLQISWNRIMCIPNFKSQGFKIKEIYVIVISILSVHLYYDIYRSRWLGGFLPLTAAKFKLVWRISDRSIKISIQIFKICYLISHTLITFSVFWHFFNFHMTRLIFHDILIESIMSVHWDKEISPEGWMISVTSLAESLIKIFIPRVILSHEFTHDKLFFSKIFSFSKNMKLMCFHRNFESTSM